jgi:hypothetical protein
MPAVPSPLPLPSALIKSDGGNRSVYSPNGAHGRGVHYKTADSERLLDALGEETSEPVVHVGATTLRLIWKLRDRDRVHAENLCKELLRSQKEFAADVRAELMALRLETLALRDRVAQLESSQPSQSPQTPRSLQPSPPQTPPPPSQSSQPSPPPQSPASKQTKSKSASPLCTTRTLTAASKQKDKPQTVRASTSAAARAEE